MTQTDPTFCFTFVCQGGSIEPKALLLAASLRRRVDRRHSIVAAIPQTYAQPSRAALALLASLEIETASVRNELPHDYPIGNKVSCLRLRRRETKQIFLDSDILLLGDGPPPHRFAGAQFHAAPADKQTFARDVGLWSAAYESVGLSVPTDRFPTSFSGDIGPPYFNAGFIVTDANVGFGEAWLDCCRAIDASAAVTNKRPWLDQIGLPVAVAKLGLSYEALGADFNFPGLLRVIPRERPPTVCHYHSPRVLADPTIRRELGVLLDENPGLVEYFEGSDDPAWREVATSARSRATSTIPIDARSAARTQSSSVTRDVFVTGMPGSGEDTLLEKLAGCGIRVVSEPLGLYRAVDFRSAARNVPAFLRRARERIESRAEVDSAARPNEPAAAAHEELAAKVERSIDPPNDTELNDVIAWQSVLLLPHLDLALSAAPAARVVILVADPEVVFARWERSARAFFDARLPLLRQSLWLPEHTRAELVQIAEESDPNWRRAMLWRLFAELMLQRARVGGDRVLVIREESLRADARRLCETVLGMHDVGSARKHTPSIAPPEPALRTSARPESDGIRALCTPAYSELLEYAI